MTTITSNLTKTKFFYLREPLSPKNTAPKAKGHPISCVAVRFDPATNNLLVGIATKHKKDPFSKKLARKIAAGRLQTAVPLKVSLAAPPQGFTDMKVKVMDNLANNVHWSFQCKDGLAQEIPQKARRAAKRWLNETADMATHSSEQTDLCKSNHN